MMIFFIVYLFQIKSTFPINLAKKIKNISLSLNLVPKIIVTLWIQWSYWPFWTGKKWTCFRSKLLIFKFKLQFGIKNNSNLTNTIARIDTEMEDVHQFQVSVEYHIYYIFYIWVFLWYWNAIVKNTRKFTWTNERFSRESLFITSGKSLLFFLYSYMDFIILIWCFHILFSLILTTTLPAKNETLYIQSYNVTITQ